MSKTVFILGAGFSAPAGMPLQSDIMFDVLRSYSQPAHEKARRIYTALFNIVDPEAMGTVPLEDVFTDVDIRYLNVVDFMCDDDLIWKW